jgi:predicted phage gp36 major capsid-like protein
VLLNRWMRGGDEAFSAAEWTQIRNTMSTTTGSEGGFTVPSLISSQVYDQMKAYGAMRVVADIIPTADGKPLSFPTTDGTAEVGEWIAQNTTATAADPVFGTASLNVFKASSKIIAVPFELLQDTILDMEGFIRKRIAQRIGRLGNLAFTIGSGTTQPDGFIPKTSAGKTGIAAQGTGVIYDDLIDLIHSIDAAYRGPGSVFMAHDTIVKTIRKLKDTAGRPIWTPSYDGGINIGLNSDGNGGYKTMDKLGTGQSTVAVPFDNLLGYRLYVNNDLATPALNSKSLAFGDFSYYKVRDAMDIQLFRFTDSAYAKLGQVGFLAWARMGGNLMDANAIKYFQCAAS